MKPAAKTLHGTHSQNFFAQSCRAQQETNQGLDSGEMLRGEHAQGATARMGRKDLPANLVREVCHIYAHRAGHRTQSVSGARPVSIVGIFLFQYPQPPSRISIAFLRKQPQPLHLTPRHYPGPRRHGESAGHAIHLAETALYALVDLLQLFVPMPVQHWKSLEITQITLWIIIKYDAWIQYSQWIE